MMEAIAIYREHFRPSEQLERPYVMLGFNVFAADTDDEARFLATSMQQAFVNLRSGRPSRLPPPVRDFEGVLSGPARQLLAQVLECSAIGGPETVRRSLHAFVARTGADELMISGMIFDHAARLRSYEIAAQVGLE